MNKPGAIQLYIKWIHISIHFTTFETKLTFDIAVFNHLACAGSTWLFHT